MSTRKRGLRIGFILFAMIALAAGVLSRVDYPTGKELTRYRNAFLAESGSDADFDWTPSTMPADYLQDRGQIPNELLHWHALPRNGDSFTRALAVAQALSAKRRVGGAIQRSAVVTLATIETEGTGYCVDYTRVFSALMYTLGIPVREWAFSFDGFGGRGHVFNEVWDIENQRWLMVDVFHGFYPRDPESGTGLSALEFRRRLASAPTSIRWERITPAVFAFKSDREALDYYQRGAKEWYLWWGNSTLGYDEAPWVAQASQFGRLPEQIAAMATGHLPSFKVLLTDQNRPAFRRLILLKYILVAAAILEILLLIALLRHLHILWSERSSQPYFPQARDASRPVR